ncbi:MAG: tetratricopeptide repeat protein, partial [Promethearchaeota archaeon]
MAYIKCLVAVSYCALGFHRESCDLFSDIFDGFEPSTVDPELRGVICLEAGKAFRANGDNNRAREFWEEALKLFEGIEDQIENYARAKANLGLVLLTDPDEEKQKKGVKIIEESSDLKRLIGDLEGLANNYCNLGMYYWRKKQYEPAIAYTRWDLYLSRKVGDLRAVASTLGNLAGIYAELKQLGPARQLLREAQQIGEALRDERLIAITEHNLRKVDEIGREAGQKGEKIGPSVECGCGSGKEYQECCGRADFEPLDIPMQFGGVSEDIEQIAKDLEDAGQEPSFLDIILRQTEQAGRRFAWARMMVHDSWLEMHELPDMANYHLNSAKILADESQSEPDSFTKPLACVILSVCALEAFINQVAFFLHETQVLAESRLHTIPSEIATDAVSFQRHTELTLKWEFLGKALCGHEWPPPLSLWTDFKNLIYIRNELVHFKAVDYEQVVPPLKKPHDIMRRVPEYVETRRIPHGWQARLLTPSFANWCVKVAESTIQHFKRSSM